MDDFTIARALHVLAIVMWIGGLAFVTTVVMPFIRHSSEPRERLAAFHRVEGRFAPQAAFWVLLAGASGFWMTWRAGLWWRFADSQYWWMHAMVGIWLIFTVMLFVLEPLVLHRRMTNSPNPSGDFRAMEWLHRILSVLSLATGAAAVAGSHGLF
ncbi:hypothetical protein [Novosphingobium sp. M1R2S20]|uniref:Integral membrane protein DUF2269 n=1 Tax=Novosphingobium rhizovicinum TaxID=3228928 RepID=A0ABV3RAY9_9SPHN